MSANCLFCKIVRGEIPVDKLYEDDEILAFRDIAPQAPVHFLVIPKKHVSSPATLSAKDDQLMGRIMRIGCGIAKQEGIDHFRAVLNNGEQAGQTVFHLHVHILGGRNMSWPPG